MVDVPESLSVTSSAFSEGGPVPSKYSCDGSDVSPPLRISGLPQGARYVALVMDDPDAPSGTWTHWAWWDLPAGPADLGEGADVTDAGAREGKNSWGRTGYGGPCPPSGTHRYYFRAFATEEPLGLPSGASVGAVWDALAQKAVAQGELMGTYSR